MSTAAATATETAPSKGLHIALWVVQGLVAFAMLGAGFMKVSSPYEQVAAQMAWAKEFAPMTVKLIGAVEIAGALGLLLPSILRIMPFLTPLAAAGLVLTMAGAAVTEASIGGHVAPPLVLGLLSAFVAWGRFRKAPIAAKA